MNEEIRDKLKSLKKITTDLANNLEIAHGIRTCKTCGHTPEIMYKEVEKLISQTRQEAVEEERGRTLKILNDVGGCEDVCSTNEGCFNCLYKNGIIKALKE